MLGEQQTLTFDGATRIVWASGTLATSLLDQGWAMFAPIFWLLFYGPRPGHHASPTLHITL
jgi:hypothetical protein